MDHGPYLTQLGFGGVREDPSSESTSRSQSTVWRWLHNVMLQPAGLVKDLRPNPTEKRWAGSQPSSSPSESGAVSCPLERDKCVEIAEVERDLEDQVQHYSRLLEKAEPEKPDAGLPGH